MSKDGVVKGSKVDAVLRMPLPKDVGTLRTIMGGKVPATTSFNDKRTNVYAHQEGPTMELVKKGTGSF